MASNLLRVSNALASVLGSAEIDVAQAVQLAVEDAQGDANALQNTLVEELGLEVTDAKALVNLLVAKRPRVEEENSDKKLQPLATVSLEAVPEEDEEDSILSDPLLAAKAGRFEQLRHNETYVARLREESRRTYLRKREAEQVELGERLLEERLWLRQQAGEITEVEAQDIRLQQQTVDIAKVVIQERTDAADASEAVYQMPMDYDDSDSKRQRFSVITERAKPKRGAANEEEAWQVEKAMQAGVAGLQQLLLPAQQPSLLTGSGGSNSLGPLHGSSTSTASASGAPRQERRELISETGTLIEFELDTPLPSLVPLHKTEEEKRGDAVAAAMASAAVKRQKAKTLQEVRRSLPVFAYRKDLLRVIRDRRVVVVVGETGSGKTTQIPQFLAEIGYAEIGAIACTQPRRVAAMSVAARVAEEMNCKLGDKVGYTIRFEDKTSESTVIKYLTDGMLLREFLTDALLTRYSVVMVDEAHERTLHTDILFALLKDLSRERHDDFRLIVSSATLEAEKFAEYFDDAPIFQIPGRLFPVDIYYVKTPEANYLMACVVAVLQIHTSQPLNSGDILVFLPGQQEIEEVQELLQQKSRPLMRDYGELLILPIYATLPTHLQVQVFSRTPECTRKVVLATNIAETSITIDNIVYVVDPGLVKQNFYSARSGIESLQVVPCSKAAVNQRAGRAGRVKPGMCFRLFPKSSYETELDDSNVPEVLRSNLASVVLSLMSMNIQDVLHFDFMDPPAPDTLVNALDLLFALGALNSRGQVTQLGRCMAEFPLDPTYARAIVRSCELGCSDEVCTIAAVLSVGNSVFFMPSDKLKRKSADTARAGFRKEGGDLPTLLNVYRQWDEEEAKPEWCQDYFVQHRSMRRAKDVREQLLGLTEQSGLEVKSGGDDFEVYGKAITAGFFPNCARLNRDGSYRTLRSRVTVHLHPQSALFIAEEGGREIVRADLLVYSEIVLTTKEFMRNVIEIKPQWLLAESGHYYGSMAAELVNSFAEKSSAAATAGRSALPNV